MLSLYPVSFNLKIYESSSVPDLWNKLPDDIRLCESLFKHKLKTYLFKKSLGRFI